MHLNDDSWSGWTATGSPFATHASAGGGFGEEQVGGFAEEACDADPEAPEGQDLLAFLSDFRSALHVEVAPSPTPTEQDVLVGGRTGRSGTENEAWLEDPYLGSDSQVAPDWWQASDRRWYPPELHPDHQAGPASSEPVAEPGVPEAGLAGPAEAAVAAETPAAARSHIQPEQVGAAALALVPRLKLRKLRRTAAPA